MTGASARRLDANEWPTFAELRLAALRESPDAFGSTYEREADNDEPAWRGWLTGGADWEGVVNSFVVEDEHGPFGIATCAVFDEAPKVGHLFSMWVAPDRRRSGAGSLLVRAVVDRARELGAEELILRVTLGNEAAIGFYRSCGFVGTADPPEPLREGSPQRTVAMRLLLGDVTDEALLTEQRRYYEARAAIYEDWYFGRGRHEREGAEVERWLAETRALEASLAAVDATGDVLELACGTGLWTRFLAPRANRLVAVDTAPSMLEENRKRVGDPDVEYVLADIFEWDTDDRFDLIAMGFFVSHIPPGRFAEFWSKLARWLRRDGLLWLADDVAGGLRPPSDARTLGGPSHAHRRKLGEATYTIVKRFFTPQALTRELAAVGWDAELVTTGEHFLVGQARPAAGRVP
jgi:SAM-dependent methyltransferase/GNAT superfamily N-acetyltransferase